MADAVRCEERDSPQWPTDEQTQNARLHNSPRYELEHNQKELLMHFLNSSGSEPSPDKEETKKGKIIMLVVGKHVLLFVVSPCMLGVCC